MGLLGSSSCFKPQDKGNLQARRRTPERRKLEFPNCSGLGRARTQTGLILSPHAARCSPKELESAPGGIGAWKTMFKSRLRVIR